MASKLEQLLDRIFGDPKVKHKLDLFTHQEKNRLQLFEKGGKIRIRCMVRDRDFVAKPEEVVRQLVLIRLYYVLGYPIDRLAVEVPVQMGSGLHKKAADMIVYRDPQKIVPYIVVEVKKPGRRDGREQLHSYMNATGAPFGLWTNGGTGKQGVAYELRTDPNLFGELPRLPAVGESLDDVLEPIRKKDLEPAEDLIGLVEQMQEEVLANAGVNVFEEVFKLFFVKLWDEENASDDPNDDSSICRFRRTADPPEEQYPRFKKLLDEATNAYPDIFTRGTDFDLSPEALMVAVSVLERVQLTDTDLELIDLTFEYLMSPESKGDKGQYFTPRQVVRMAVKMLNPTMNETMLDPASGPCGFPIHTLLYVREHQLRGRYADWEARVQRYGRRNLFAVDFDGRVVRVARFMLRLAGDGRANVFRMNSLDQREWGRDQAYRQQVARRQFDLIMTNPPFAGTIRHPQILSSYDLGFNETQTRRHSADELHITRTRKQVNSQTRDVFFMEYCLNKLKPGGRMAIVLPQGNFNNLTAEQIRRYVMSRGRVLAVVGLDVNTFKPHTGTKTSVLFVQRWAGEEADAWATWYDDLYEHEAAVAEYEALRAWRKKLLRKGKSEEELPAPIRQPPPHPGDPPPPPSDYPIFFATSRRSGRDNSGRYDYLKDEDGQVVMAPKLVLAHDETGARIEVEQDRPVLNTDLDEIAEAFVAWAREQKLDFFATSPYDGPAFAEVVAGADFDVSEVMLSDLEIARRLDAEYYRPAYLQYAAVVSAGDSLDDLAEILHPTEVKRLYEDEGIQILLAQNIRNNSLDFSTAVFMSSSTRRQLSRNKLQFNDVAMTRSGANFGDAAVYKGEPEDIYACADVLVIRPRDVPGGYLATYFNTKTGRALLTRGAYGLAQPHIAPNYLYTMHLPRLGDVIEREIDDLVAQAYEKQNLSKDLYHQAEQLLLDELGLRDLELPDELHGEATLTDVLKVSRLDAEFFETRYGLLFQTIERTGQGITLGQVVTWIQRGTQPSYVEDGPVFVIKSKDVREQFVDLDAAERTSLKFWQENEHARVKQYDVLVNSTGRGTLGRVNCYLASDKAAADGHVTVIRPIKQCDPVYLSVFLNSYVGRLQSERLCSGSSGQTELYPDAIAQIYLFLPEKSFQLEIRDLVIRSYTKRLEAQSLSDQATCSVEMMIESGATDD